MATVNAPSGEKVKRSSRGNDNLCECGSNDAITMYCEGDTTLCCKTCERQNHRHCRSVVEIARASTGILTSKIGKELPGKLQSLISSFANVESSAQSVQDSIPGSKAECLQVIQQHRENINRVFDKLQNEVEAELDHVANVTTSQIFYHLKTCKEAVSELNGCQKAVESTMKTKSNNNIFIALRKAQKMIDTYSHTLANIKPECKKVQLRFEVDQEVEKFVRNLEAVGKVVMERDSSVNSRLTLPPVEEITATLVGEENVLIPSDEKKCYIRGVAALEESHVLISDYKNEEMKLFDDMFILLSKLNMSSGPDHFSVSGSSVAVALPDENKIQLLWLEHGELVPQKSFLTSGACFGVALLEGGRMALSLQDRIEIVDSSGSVHTKLQKNDKGENIFKRSASLAVTKDKLLVVADEANGLIGVTLSGDVKFVYNGIKSPQAVTLDSNDNIYIGSWKTRKIDLLTPSGRRVTTVMSYSRGLKTGATAMAFDGQRNTLIASRYQWNSLALFKLT